MQSEPPITYEIPARPASVPAQWLTYHLAHPGPGKAMPGDPNCAFLWQGRYHLHYIYRHHDGFAFAHVSSSDLLHWTWHPTTLTPSRTGHGMYSGSGFLTKEGRPAIIYHGEGSNRNQIAVAEDDQLERWSAPWPLEPVVRPDQDGSTIANWDPDAWLDGDTYYALSGGSPGSGKPPTLFSSTDLTHWDFLGLFLDHDLPGVQADEDISCPNFFRIGNKHMLLCISHTLGCRYYLGDWKGQRFHPDFHARMNWHTWDCFAPESLVTADGRRVMWAWCNLDGPQSGIQSLPRELSLPEDGVLRIMPLRELERLRGRERSDAPGHLPEDGTTHVLKGLSGTALELQATFAAGATGAYGVEVYGGFRITVIPDRGLLCLGTVRVPFTPAATEAVTLRIFLDQQMIEVFANDRQAAIAAWPPAVGDVRLFNHGGRCTVSACRSWPMGSIY